MERIRQRRLNQKISRSEQAEAGSKHHRPKSKLSTRSGAGGGGGGGPSRKQKEVISRDPGGNHLDLSHWSRWYKKTLIAGNKEALLQKLSFVHSTNIYVVPVTFQGFGI